MLRFTPLVEAPGSGRSSCGCGVGYWVLDIIITFTGMPLRDGKKCVTRTHRHQSPDRRGRQEAARNKNKEIRNF